jgi:purine-binding chemotaxis protein CheW
MDIREWDKDTRIVVCDVDDHQIGMIVDSVDEVLRIPKSDMEPAPGIVTSAGVDYIRGVARIDKRLLIFLDISKIASEIGHVVEEQLEPSISV